MRRGGLDNRWHSTAGARAFYIARKYKVTMRQVRMWKLANPYMTNEARKVLVNEIRRKAAGIKSPRRQTWAARDWRIHPVIMNDFNRDQARRSA
jgi:hypothetical protein